MRIILLSAALLLTTSAFAQDPQLADLRATLVSLRSAEMPDFVYVRLGPKLSTAKHQLRDWIEMRLGSLKDETEDKAFADQLNAALKAVDIGVPADDQNFMGTIGGVSITRESGMLIVTTSLGIICQFDDSAYGYKFRDGKWRRVWESEQTDYSETKYAPQHMSDVHVLQPFKEGHESGSPFVLTLGNHWGCASSWHPVYFRVWRADTVGSKLLLDKSESAWMRTGRFIVGSIGMDWKARNAPVDVLIEYTTGSVDAGVHNREAVHHYLIEGDRVRRVAPVALSPRDFVDEWLTRPWTEAADLSASPNLKQWHAKLHADYTSGEFIYSTQHCETPDLWQVIFEPHNAKKDFKPDPAAYFLIQWRPPYRFTVMDVSDKPWPRCKDLDPEADEWRTLFSTQDWRR